LWWISGGKSTLNVPAALAARCENYDIFLIREVFQRTLLDIFCTPERCSGNSWLFIMPEQRSSIPVFHPSEKMSSSVISHTLLSPGKFQPSYCNIDILK
jgi:hypothetical protein